MESTAVGVTAAKVVRAGEGDDFLVVEAHTIKDVSYVGCALSGVGEAAMGWEFTVVDIICAPRLPRDLWSAHFFDSYDPGESPEILKEYCISVFLLWIGIDKMSKKV